MNKELICIVCPMGCQLNVQMENGNVVSVSGNTCPRGENYAKTELINPMRVITTTVRTEEGALVPVKTDGAVPKAKIFDCMDVINKLHPKLRDCEIGSVVLENMLSTEVNVVVTAPANQR